MFQVNKLSNSQQAASPTNCPETTAGELFQQVLQTPDGNKNCLLDLLHALSLTSFPLPNFVEGCLPSFLS